jgi:lysophospholipase L1-like esterase
MFDSSIGYEFKPGANFNGERLDKEGFRSEDLPFTKGPDEFRIMAVGDSTCFALGVPRDDSWPYILGQLLNRTPRTHTKKVEVMNTGIPGYVSFQAFERLKRRGIQYKPDVVVAMVGWNDAGYSSLPDWKPGIDLSKMPNAVLRRDVIAGSRLLCLIAQKVERLRHMYIGPESSRKDSGRPFEERGLELYLNNLDAMREVSAARGAGFAVVAWPALLKVMPLPDGLDRRLNVTAVSFPLSLREWRMWYARYIAGIRQFTQNHPETILIDPTQAFTASPLKGDLFLDMVHLTPSGNRLLAVEVARVLLERGVL